VPWMDPDARAVPQRPRAGQQLDPGHLRARSRPVRPASRSSCLDAGSTPRRPPRSRPHAVARLTDVARGAVYLKAAHAHLASRPATRSSVSPAAIASRDQRAR
jgi:hypothetical protein